MKIKNIAILSIVSVFFLNVGFWSAWFYAPQPRWNLIYNAGGVAVGIEKGVFNKPDKNRWMKWEDYKRKFTTNEKK